MFGNYHDNNLSESDDFRQMIVDVKRLIVLAHDEDKNNHPLCACLCIYVGVQEWTLHAITKK